MSANTILIVLLVIVAMRPFFEFPSIEAKSVAQAKGGYRSRGVDGCLYVVLMPTTVGLWWWYALTTDQILLGVIPTVAFCVSVTVVGLGALMRKAEREAKR